MKKNFFTKEINVADAKTSIWELIRETLINFSWGFFGNSIVVFMAKYESIFGKFVVLPGSAALGAFTGYKVAQLISNIL